MPTTTDIADTIEKLRAAEKPNIAAVAKKRSLVASTLSRQRNKTTVSRSEYRANMRLLSPQQDKKLVEFVRKLTLEGLPLISKIIRQFALDISNRWLSKNWPANWLKTYQNELGSGWLKGFDLARKKADNHWQYKAYFEFVFNSFSQTISKINLTSYNKNSINTASSLATRIIWMKKALC
jgi:hypothetical protein